MCQLESNTKYHNGFAGVVDNEGWLLSVPLGPLNAKSTRVQWSLTGVRSSWTDNGIYRRPSY